MKLKIICIVVALVGTHFIASSNNCTTACDLKMVGKQDLKNTGAPEKITMSDDEEDLTQFSLLPFHNFLFNL